MRLGLLVLPLLALPLACSFDSIGQPEAGSDEAAGTGSETATEGTGDEIGTGDQGSSSESMGDGDGESSSDTSTDDATTDTTDDATTTTDTTDDATTTTDTTDTGTDTTDTSDGNDGDTTTTDTGMEPDYYEACPNGEDDCVPSEYCKVDADIFDTWSVCATPCESADECPVELGFEVICINYEIFAQKTCHIDCFDNDCPPGMSCKDVNAGFDRICVYEP